MTDLEQLKRKIHNLRQQRSRLKIKQQDPDGYLIRERERKRKYWAELDLQKKLEKISRQGKLNKKNRIKLSFYQRKSYLKNRKKILDKKRIHRINRPEYYRNIAKKTYRNNRKKILHKMKMNRVKNGEQMRARERQLYKLKKNNND